MSHPLLGDPGSLSALASSLRSRAVQLHADLGGGEISPAELWTVFADEYLPVGTSEARWGRFELRSVESRGEVDADDTLDEADRQAPVSAIDRRAFSQVRRG